MKKHGFIILGLSFFINVIYAQVDHWETVVYADDVWRYRRGYSGLPSDWNQVGFNESGWFQGQGGIGYGDGDDNTVISPTVSLFIRKRFELVDISKIENAILHADYDDGFVAYINGVEVARSNMDGAAPAYFEEATALHEATMYSGGLPEDFVLNSSQLNGLSLSNENVLAIQIHNYDGLNSSDLTSNFFLSLGINDDSNYYGDTPDWFIDSYFLTPLPIVKVQTNGAEIPDEPSIPAQMGIIWNGAGEMNSSFGDPDEYFGNISIERRGQSSLALFPKNGFAIETKDEFGEDMDVSFLNFPEEEDWILHGPYSDKTLMRNVLIMHMARSMGQYASRTRIVELVINEKYEGIYVLMERIKRDKNRVDIASLQEDDLSGDELTGGYVFKVDKGDADWYSRYDMENVPGAKLPYQFVSPNRSKIQPEQETYIQLFVDSFEQAIRSPNLTYAGKRYDEFIDLTSFADNFILNELSKNIDAFRLSSYFFKDKDSNDGKINAGPVWDFNLAFGNANYCNGGSAFGWIRETACGDPNPFWWSRLVQDPKFVNLLKCRWESFKNGPLHPDTLLAFIDMQVDLLEPALERNFTRWPVLDEYVWPNEFVFETYEQEIDFMKNFLKDRLVWMDANIYGQCTTVGADEVVENYFQISPNPATHVINLTFGSLIPANAQFFVHDMLGSVVISGRWETPSDQLSLNLGQLPNGTYQIIIIAEKAAYNSSFMVVN
ncbi:MAG: CotH kinase family protein [Bacteroidota bacterium]